MCFNEVFSKKIVYRRLGEHLEEHLPNLESLILTGNHIEELTDIDCLANLEKLSTISLMQNPITAKQHYRLYIIFKLPQIRLLDFRKVKLKERDEARALFKSKKGKEIQKEISKRAKTFIPGANLDNVKQKNGPSEQELRKIREAIAKASSLEEVERLQMQLQAGLIPGHNDVTENGQHCK